MGRWGWRVAFIVIIALVVLLDRVTWKLACLEHYVGRSDGLAAPVDRFMAERLRPGLDREQLERMLLDAKNVKEYCQVSAALFKLLGEQGRTTDQRELMSRVVKRYGRENDSGVTAAHVFLARHYLRAGKRAELLSSLRHLRAVAKGPPLHASLLLDVLGWARDGGLDDFFLSAAEEARVLPGMKPAQRLAVALDLQRFYEKAGRTADLARVRKCVAEYKQGAKIGRLVADLGRRIDGLLRKKRLAEALARLRDAFADYPEYASSLADKALGLAHQACRRKRPEMVVAAWKLLRAVEPPPAESRARRDTPGRARESMSLLLSRGRFRDARLIGGIADQLAPGGVSYEYFFKGEEWARGGRKGASPKPIYRVAYRPDASLRVDGVLDEPVWRRIAPMPGPFWESRGRKNSDIKPAGALKLDARIFYTKKLICIGVRCPEPFINEIKRSLPAGSQGNAWIDDCIEFFVGYRRDFSYRQYVAAASGAYRVYYINERAPRRRPGCRIRTAAAMGADHYTIEFTIPLDLLPVKDDIRGRLVIGNLRRNRFLDERMAKAAGMPGSKRSEISWSRIAGDCHGYERMDFLEFE